MAAGVPRVMSPAEAAKYIEQTCAELKEMASSSNLEFLGCLIDMARLEAASQAAQNHQPRRRE
jgi:hypothetical protein